MIIAVSTIALVCMVVGAGVLRSNPRRFANQVFAGVSLLAAAWVGTIATAMIVGSRYPQDPAANPIAWLRANAAIAAFFPAVTVLLAEAVCGGNERRKAFRRCAPIFLVSFGLAVTVFSDAYIPSTSTPLHPQRGPGYLVHCGVMIGLYVAIIGRGFRRMRQQSGLRRVEMQFLTLNLSITLPLVMSAMVIGNLLHQHAVKEVALLGLLAASGLSWWALTVHRIYDARQLVLALAQRALVVAALVAGIWVSFRVLGGALHELMPILVSVGVCTPLAFWLDRRSRVWLDLAGERRFAEMRTTVINLARTEPKTETLVLQIENLAEAHWRVAFTAVLVQVDAGFARGGLHLPSDCGALRHLAEHGWATPEALDRQQETPEVAELRALMAKHSLGLIVTAPTGATRPSLVMVLGMKKNRWPFTFPEIRHVCEIAQIADNVLVRTRVVAEAGLKAKLDHLAMMSRGLAHDLKNLITPISSYLVHTTGRHEPGSAEEEVHEAARRSVAVIADYVTEALFFAKRLTPNFRRVSVRDVVATVVDLTAARAARRGVIVASCLQAESFAADAVLIQRLLTNLTNNAIDASTPGSNVMLAVSNPTQDRIRIEVRDEGVGIAPEHAPRIFEPYFTTKQFGDDTRGFGLGLTICDKIVALHQGTISVQSELGIGTTFTVDLPVAQSVTRSSPVPGAGVGA